MKSGTMRSGSMTARQPFPKGANASPEGTMRSKMTNGIIRPPFSGGSLFGETEDQMKLHLIDNEGKKLKCVFNTLAIKNESPERFYKGGLIGFLDKYGGECECNAKITVVYYILNF